MHREGSMIRRRGVHPHQRSLTGNQIFAKRLADGRVLLIIGVRAVKRIHPRFKKHRRAQRDFPVRNIFHIGQQNPRGHKIFQGQIANLAGIAKQMLGRIQMGARMGAGLPTMQGIMIPLHIFDFFQHLLIFLCFLFE